MAADIDEMTKRYKFENRIASGWVNGVRVTVQVRVGDDKYQGDPYVVAGPAGQQEYEHFDSIDAAVERFEELSEEHDLS